MTAQLKLSVKHMEKLGGITKFANNTYELKVKKIHHLLSQVLL